LGGRCAGPQHPRHPQCQERCHRQGKGATTLRQRQGCAAGWKGNGLYGALSGGGVRRFGAGYSGGDRQDECQQGAEDQVSPTAAGGYRATEIVLKKNKKIPLIFSIRTRLVS